MSMVKAFHTDSPEYAPSHREVYHDESTCSYGKEVKAEHRLSGTGDKKRCKQCEKSS